MLCSFTAGKTGSSWLNRLRSAKGFPEDAACDLEHFLQNAPTPNSEITNDQNPETVPIFDTVKDQDKKFINMMSSVICELFNFGGNCSNSREVKKSARKQANPKICAFLKSNDGGGYNVDSEKVASRSGDSNSGVDGVKQLNGRKDEGEGREVNLPGFSRTEVTVIDTSYETWKFDKLLYRKKNVWKVREKKGKSDSMGSKRKKRVSGIVDDDQHGKKQRIEAKDELPLNEVYRQKDKLDFSESASDKVREVLKKKRTEMPSQKLEKERSSIIRITSIPISKKNATSSSKNCHKLKLNKP